MSYYRKGDEFKLVSTNKTFVILEEHKYHYLIKWKHNKFSGVIDKNDLNKRILDGEITMIKADTFPLFELL